MAPDMHPKEMLECVAFILVRDRSFLAERRGLSKALAPGAVAIPGGHLENDESQEDGLRRELAEELDLQTGALRYVCSLLDQSEELRRIHYYAIDSWQGEMANNEADELVWLPLANPEQLDLQIDRVAVAEFRRLYDKA